MADEPKRVIIPRNEPVSPTGTTVPAMQRPVEKPTRAVEPPPPWAIALSEKVENGFDDVKGRLDKVESNQEVQGSSLRVLAQTVALHVDSIAKLEGRVGVNSVRAKATSENDLKQDSVISQVLVKQDAFEKKLDAFGSSLATNNADTSAIRTQLVDAAKGFWKRHPKLETGLVALILAVFGLGVAGVAYVNGRLNAAQSPTQVRP